MPHLTEETNLGTIVVYQNYTKTYDTGIISYKGKYGVTILYLDGSTRSASYSNAYNIPILDEAVTPISNEEFTTRYPEYFI